MTNNKHYQMVNQSIAFFDRKHSVNPVFAA